MKIYETDSSFAKYETLFYMGNGNIGIRNSLEEKFFNRATYINGFYDTFDLHYEESYTGFSHEGEKMVQVFDGQRLDIYLDGVLVTFDNDFIQHARYIDMNKGTYTRKYKYLFDGHIINFKVTKFVSFYKLNMACASYDITCDTASVSVKNHILTHNERVIDYKDIRVDHNVNNVEICENFKGFLKGKTKHLANETTLHYSYSCEYDCEFINDGVVISLPGKFNRFFSYNNEKICQNLDILLEEQEKFMGKYWENAKINFQDKEFDAKINYSLYALLQSTPIDGSAKVSVAAKGISGDGYCGHYFWDTEMYLFPVYLWTNPKLAKNLLEYRYSLLDSAKKYAKEVGYTKGALYPWRTIAGRESSGFFESGMAQHHISLDIAYAFINYYRVTKDKEFMLEKGLEVIEETAKLFLDIGYIREGSFHIDMVTGPDEYSALVNDNYYTNILCKYNFEWLVKIADELNVDILDRDEYITNAKIIYTKSTKNITWQDRDFLNKKKWNFNEQNKFPLLMHYHPLYIYRHQVCKQPDVVLAHLLREEEVSFKELEATINYYDTVTTHDSSLSFSIFSILYNRIGNKKKSYDYFMKNAVLDIDDVHDNVKDGIHVASMGGTWMALLYGFMGLRLKENGLNFYPSLPKNVSPFKMYIEYGNSKLLLEIDYNSFKVFLVKGNSLEIIINDEKQIITK